ncbi:glycosyltransferase family 87 protein [Sphingomicrobium arenosum]|uniref:glycosyltransferase family 87 protein n=1 Tax=Sphingomicrobium arenosum TaxID=2233861 RepID=UPI00223EFD8C|nr:glycosyltransferase family 87 protein [Sphingomicrobium arenosum]
MGADRFDPQRGNAPPSLALWLVLLLVAAYPKIWFILGDWVTREGLMLPNGGTWFGRDFSNLYLGGRLAMAGEPIYDVIAYQALLADFGITAGQNSSYPPTVYLLGAPLSFLPYGVALALWHVGGALLFVLAARRFIPFHWGWLFLFPPMLSIPNGQYGLYTAALWMFAFAGSGVAAGIATIKPHLGIFLALAMLVQRRWRMIATAIAVALALLIAAELAFGLTRDFLTQGTGMQMRILLTDTAQPYFSNMPSTFVMLRGTPLAWAAQVAVAIAAFILILPILKLPLHRQVFALATATFVVLPYAFAYDMAVVQVGIAAMLWRDWGRMGLIERLALPLAFLATVYVVLTPVALLATLVIQRRVLLAETRHLREKAGHEEDRDHHQTLQAR